jgi:hypothetical protein
MKIKYFERLKNRLDISGKAFISLLCFSFCYFAGCLVYLIPAARDFIIMFGGLLVRHPLNYDLWYSRFSTWGISGIILFILFFTAFFSNNIFLTENLKKKMYPFVMIFITLGVFVIMFHANWTFGDDQEYIATTAVNEYMRPYISGGRFYPLGHVHYNLPLFIFRLLGIGPGLPVEAHFVLVAVFYVLSVVSLFSLFNRIEPVKERSFPVFSAFFACIFFLLGRAFCNVFMRLIFPETQVIMLFAVFMLMYYRALETGKKRYYIASFLAALYSSYCKEPVFGAFLTFAVTNLLFRHKNQSKSEKIFYAALIAHAVLFVALYYLLSYRNASGFYNEGRVEFQGFQFIFSILINTPLLIVIAAFGLFRFGVIVVKKDRGHLYYDTLLFAGIAYSFAYVLLRLNSSYYFLPSIILFLPSLVYWTKYWYSTKKNHAFAAFGLILLICFFNLAAVVDISNIWRERKNFIPYISNLLLEYNEGKTFIWYESDNTLTGNTFYKDVRSWRKGVENAFLNYKNKSEGKDFFTVSKNMDEIVFDKNVLFFYPIDNDQNQPMPEYLLKVLHGHNFYLFTDSYGVLIYKRN